MAADLATSQRNRPPTRPPADADGSLRGFRRLATVTAGLTLVLIAMGGAVRATDSGLACPDWPACFGMWIPPADVNIWLEHSHRLVAGVVGLLTAALAVWAVARLRARRHLVVVCLAALVLVLVQAALGALVVLHLLRAELVTAHLGMAMVVLACLLYLAVSAGLPPRDGGWNGFTKAAAAVAGLVYVQILVGGHVTGIGASLVYTDFPLMDGALVPAVSNAQEFFHVAHRLLAYAIVAASVWLAVRVLRHRRQLQAAGQWTDSHRWLVKLTMWGATLVMIQIGIGVANLWTNASYVTVIPHLAVASWIWATLFGLTLLSARLGPAPATREVG